MYIFNTFLLHSLYIVISSLTDSFDVSVNFMDSLIFIIYPFFPDSENLPEKWRKEVIVPMHLLSFSFSASHSLSGFCILRIFSAVQDSIQCKHLCCTFLSLSCLIASFTSLLSDFLPLEISLPHLPHFGHLTSIVIPLNLHFIIYSLL